MSQTMVFVVIAASFGACLGFMLAAILHSGTEPDTPWRRRHEMGEK